MEYTFNEIRDREIWENFVSEHAPYALFQSWLWGEVQKAMGITVLRYGCYQKNVLAAVFMAITVPAKRGMFVHVRHGPVVGSYTRELWKQIFEFLAAYTQSQRGLFFRISPLMDVSNETLLHDLGTKDAQIHAMDAEYCWVLQLDEDEETLLKQMRKTTRYEIKKAKQMGVSVSATTDEHDLDIFFDLYNQTAKRQGFVPHKGIQEEFTVFAKEQQALVYTAVYESKPIASAIILFTGSQGIYHHGASLTNKIPGSYAIQWEAIREAKKRGMKQYNFWGIAPDNEPNHPWKGLTLFKQGFGGSAVQFLHAQDYPVSPLYVIPNTIERIRKIRKGY